MEGQVWSIVCTLIPVSESMSKRFCYSDGEILAVILWAVLHDRPMCWACDARNWAHGARPAQLPHPSTLSRRWRRGDLQRCAQSWHRRIVARLKVTSRYAAVDGRALTIGGCSKDPDCRSGRAAGGMGKGYKLHAMVGTKHEIVDYSVWPLNKGEQKVAVDLLRHAPATVTRIVADANYDSMNLHRVAAENGQRWYTPLRQGRVGKRQQPARLHLLRLSHRSVGQRLLAWRDTIERTFGQASNVAFGYKGLPPWARRLHRVQRWMWGKTLLHNAWLLLKREAA
jgi:IS5 family transposase